MVSSLKVLLVLPFIITATNLYAISNPYRGGKVNISIKNGLPCFHISDSLSNGEYSLVILLPNNNGLTSWTYENTFEKKNASESSCILWGEKGFSNYQKPYFNVQYGVTFGTDRKAYHSDFCLAQKEGETIIQEVKNNQCYEPPKGMWQLIKEALNDYF